MQATLRLLAPLLSVKRLNPQGKTTVHTIGLVFKTGEALLREIASQNGGNYKFVSEDDIKRISDEAKATARRRAAAN